MNYRFYPKATVFILTVLFLNSWPLSLKGGTGASKVKKEKHQTTRTAETSQSRVRGSSFSALLSTTPIPKIDTSAIAKLQLSSCFVEESCELSDNVLTQHTKELSPIIFGASLVNFLISDKLIGDKKLPFLESSDRRSLGLYIFCKALGQNNYQRQVLLHLAVTHIVLQAIIAFLEENNYHYLKSLSTEALKQIPFVVTQHFFFEIFHKALEKNTDKVYNQLQDTNASFAVYIQSVANIIASLQQLNSFAVPLSNSERQNLYQNIISMLTNVFDIMIGFTYWHKKYSNCEFESRAEQFQRDIHLQEEALKEGRRIRNIKAISSSTPRGNFFIIKGANQKEAPLPLGSLANNSAPRPLSSRAPIEQNNPVSTFSPREKNLAVKCTEFSPRLTTEKKASLTLKRTGSSPRLLLEKKSSTTRLVPLLPRNTDPFSESPRGQKLLDTVALTPKGSGVAQLVNSDRYYQCYSKPEIAQELEDLSTVARIVLFAGSWETLMNK